ncbi:uncharacterized protein A1O5_13401 [Cladophialophora psammophila CBS 110553]|uniref:AB hydrolase-1 domain-containing protein n=1 Tax=Cladophialophora psammophila CBS 110553 TaxID=1182543 RepID=W9VMN0_9EURO|nr:uncharacterized protein A1O5_13401 [Cladophialophora psammophila CBS 110553]EXJ53361.1 hypothetical protein A1O5_13401 [Cladophialophora psammophila CBS 110553]
MASQEISAEFPFTKQRVPILDSTMAYIDTGAPNPTSPAVVFVHGNPTSSYIWRNVIPHLSPIARCIAPDLIGFGDSGKMPSNSYYVRDHIQYFDAFMDKIIDNDGKEKLFLVVHDWGSALGLHWASRNEEKVAGLIFMEFILPGMKLDDLQDGRQIFHDFRTEGIGRKLIVEGNVFIELVLAKVGVRRGLTEAELAHYRAPFLDPKAREPIYRFPNELPFDGHPADVAELVQAYFTWLTATPVPKLMFWGTPGAIVSVERAKVLADQMKNVKSVGVGPGNHYLQEDNPHLIGRETKEFVEQVWRRKE